jgi:hypothetical protein
MTQETEARQSRILLLVLLVLTAALAVAWSAHRNLNQDEGFVFQTDTVPTLHHLMDVQLHYPIALDPLFYHLLGFASVKMLGATPIAIRLPSIAGFLLMQVCLYAVTKRIAGGFAGFVAAWVPAVTATLFFAQQTRPYGVLLGLGALLLLAYQRGTREGSRTGWLITLAVALALALNSHYFAILLLIPLYAAEAVRIVTQRRIDWPMIFAIAAGSAGELLTLPFQPGASEFRRHYYNAGKVTLHAITQSYRSLFINYTGYSIRVQHVIMGTLVLASIALAAALAARVRAKDVTVPTPERVFLVTLALLPFFGYLLAKYVTHAIEVRYILPTIIGVAVLIALAALPLYRNPRTHLPLAVFCLVWLAVAGCIEVRGAGAERQSRTGHIVLNAPAGNAPIYMQSMGLFDEVARFVPDPALRSRISLVYSAPFEIELSHHDTQSLTAEHMRHFTRFNIVRYEDLRAQPGPHLFVIYPHGSGWDWLATQLQRDHAAITSLGPAMEGELVSVTFPETAVR